MAIKLISKRINKMIKLKIAMEKLQRSLQIGKKLSTPWSTTSSDVEDLQDLDEQYEHEDEVYDSNSVPQDVKEGHFAVVVVDVDYGVARRFVVPLRCLKHPVFVALLERAAEEYGFEHGGALTVPCRISEMERILDENYSRKSSDCCRLSSNNIMLQSY